MKHKLLNKLWLRGLMLVALMCTTFTGAQAGDVTVKIDINSFTGLPKSASYSTYTWSQDGLSGKATIYGSTSATSMQFNASNYLFYSTSAVPGIIKSIKMTTASGTNRTYVVYGSTSAYSGSGTSYGTQIGSQTVTTSGTTFTVSSGSYTYFAIVKSGSGAGYLSSIEVTYTPQHTLAYSATNGSIVGKDTQSATVANGASVAEDATVTLTATPSDGYEFSNWVVSGEGSSLSSTTDNPTTFTMGTADATVTANFVESASATYSVTYNANGATSGSVPTDNTEYAKDASVTVLGNTGSLAKTGCAFGGWNTQADGGGTNYSAGNTFSITANTTLYAKWNPYTITAQSNNSNYGTVSGTTTITATPKDGYRVVAGDGGYTVTSGTAEVTNNGDNTFTIVPTSDCTVRINFEAIPTHTATFSVNESTTSNTFYEGQAITFPSNPSDIAGRTFVGWVTSPIDGTTDEAPAFVTSATMGGADVTYYAVFAIAEESGEPVETKAQTLQYDTWTYSGTTTNKTTYRLFGSSSYIESASFDLSKLSKVIVYAGTFGTLSTKTISVKVGSTTWGTTSALTTKDETTANEITSSTTLSGNGNIHIVPNDGDGSNNGFRISKVEIFIQEPSIDYSGYCTTITITKVETPVISPASGAVASGTMVTISCATDGATIYYTTDGTNPTTSSEKYSEAIEITSATTIKAIAVKDGLTDSEVASASYTIALPCATPTFSVAAGEVAKGTTVEISTETEDATIYYTTNGDTPTTSSTPYSSAITINTAQTIKAIAVKDGMLNSEVASVTYTVIDYTTLPFEWTGGTSSTLKARTGVTSYGLGSDYASSNAPYYIKMDGADDYIQIKTNAQPGRVYVDVKMIGGGTQSKIKVQESANGTDFTDVDEFTIKGSQNDILSFETAGIFNVASRYVRIIKSVHGSNIGVGPITITGCESVTVGSAGYTTYTTTGKVFFPSGVTGYIATATHPSTVTLTSVESVPASTPIVLKADAGTYYLPVITSTPDDVTGNLLEASDGTVEGDGSTIFALAKKNDVVGFYLVNDGVTVPAGKAYLTVGAAVKEFLTFDFVDDADGIQTLSDSPLKGESIYNLAGQRIQKMQKGINIVNGKKILK